MHEKLLKKRSSRETVQWLRNHYILLISLLYIVWGAAFIWRSSFIAIDGNRYFCLFDDAMISMRYAWNFSHGFGLVWNPGEYVEGYTNLLMVLVMALPTLVFDKINAVLAIQIIGIGFMLGNAYLTMSIAVNLEQNSSQEHQSLFGILAFIGTLTYYPLSYWSLMGMETGLLTLLLLLSILFTLKFVDTQNSRYLLYVTSCLGLAYMTRPDAAIFTLPIFTLISLELYRSAGLKQSILRILLMVTLYASLPLAQMIFRWYYYGELLPNTYILKMTGMPILDRMENGGRFVTPFLHQIKFFLFLPIIGLLLKTSKFHRKKLFLFSFIILAVTYQVYNGGDPWQYWRILSPTVPATIILFIDAVIDIAHCVLRTKFSQNLLRDREYSVYKKEYLPIIFIFCLGMLSTFTGSFLFQLLLIVPPYKVGSHETNINRAIAIRELTTENASIGVFWAGAIPYYTERHAVDFLGKTDKYVASLAPDMKMHMQLGGMQSIPGHNKYDLNYSIKNIQPTVVMSFHWENQNISDWAEHRYVLINYHGASLFLQKDSQDVYWDKARSYISNNTT